MNNLTAFNATTLPPALPPRDPVWYTVLAWLIAGVILIGNGLVMYLIITRRRLHITNNYFIFSMAVADISTGIIIIPATYTCKAVPSLNCNWKIAYAVFNTFLFASVANLCAMTLDRYISIVIPLKYFMYMTRKVVTIILCVTWVVPFVLAFLPLTWSFEPDNAPLADKIFDPIQIFVFVVLPITLILLVYARIFIIARKISKQTSQTQNQLRFNDSNANSSQPSEIARKERRERRNREGSVGVIGAVIILFAICYVVAIYVSICQVFKVCTLTYDVLLISQTFLHFNAAVNPIVYSMLKKDIKTELRRLVHGRARGRERGWETEFSSFSTAMSTKLSSYK